MTGAITAIPKVGWWVNVANLNEAAGRTNKQTTKTNFIFLPRFRRAASSRSRALVHSTPYKLYCNELSMNSFLGSFSECGCVMA